MLQETLDLFRHCRHQSCACAVSLLLLLPDFLQVILHSAAVNPGNKCVGHQLSENIVLGALASLKPLASFFVELLLHTGACLSSQTAIAWGCAACTLLQLASCPDSLNWALSIVRIYLSYAKEAAALLNILVHGCSGAVRV